MDSVKLLDFFGYFAGYLNYLDDYCLISYENYYFYFYWKNFALRKFLEYKHEFHLVQVELNTK